MASNSSPIQHGYLLLADISGFTSFIAGTELDHSHEIMTELLELIVGCLTPPLTLSKLEGDAVFAYAPESRLLRGESLLPLIESTYVAFRDRLTNMHRRTTCTCNACRAIPSLDLKFMAHHGAYVVQNVIGRSELVGSDVNLVHRLLKNHVSEATGWKAYALFTAKSLEHTGIRLADAHPQTENYEHLGDIQTYSLNLAARYKEIVGTRKVLVTPEEADVLFTHELPAALPVAWEWLNDPLKRSQWMGGRTWSAAFRPGGQTGVGARNHCAHGKTTIVETVLDWRPFDYVTGQQQLPGKMIMLETIRFEPLPDGGRTRVYDQIKIHLPLPRWLRRPLVKFMLTQVKYKTDEQYADLARLIAEAGNETARRPL